MYQAGNAAQRGGEEGRSMEHLPVILGATLVWFAAIVSPGPNFLVISRLALSRSLASAIAATFGIAVGSLGYAALTMFGLSALILRFAWLGDTLRVLGGAYLTWLGIQAWRAKTEKSPSEVELMAATGRGSMRGIRVGFLTEITNPKGIAFFLGLFAAAVPAATPLWAKVAILSVGGVMEIAWYTVVALALSSAPMRAGYQQVRRGVDRALGTLLIAVGVRVAFETRWIDACVKWIRTMYARNKAVHAASNLSWRQSLNDALLAW
jgi:threonine efflux protein